MDEILDRFVADEIAPHMALMQLFVRSGTEAAAREKLSSAIELAPSRSKAKLLELKSLWDRSPESFSAITQIHRIAATGANTTGNARVREYREVFDRAVSISTEASVALYSLGDRELLESITGEAVDLMRHWQLFDQTSVVLEIGCGTGRFVRALAPRVRKIIGVDISGEMLRHAGERLHDCKNTLLVQTAGRDLSMLPDEAFDLVLAIDSFPYIVDAGAADLHFRDSARILTRGGRMLVMNFDYISSLESQQEKITESAAKYGFSVLRSGTRDMQSWDGRTFLLQKRAT